MKLSRNMAGIALAALALSACEADLGPNEAADPELDEDVAMVAADAALEDLAQMSFSVSVPAQSYGLASGPVVERSRTVTFFDAEGGEQDRYNAETTASIRIQVSVSGEMERDDWSAAVERSRDLTVSGLTGDEQARTWNGTGEGAVSGTRHSAEGTSRTREMVSSSTIEDVVRGLPRDENPYPLSGSITRTVTVTWTEGDRTETRTRTAVLTFDGTQFATLTVGDLTFEVDLAAREGDRAHRNHG